MDDNNTDVQTIKAFVDLVCSKAKVDPSNALSIKLDPQYRATITAYVTDANGVKVINREYGVIPFMEIDVTLTDKP